MSLTIVYKNLIRAILKTKLPTLQIVKSKYPISLPQSNKAYDKLQQNLLQDPLVQYISIEFRRHQVTQELNCKAHNEAAFLANTYLYYLNSCERHQSLIDTYGSKGERSAKEAARLVGLEMPDTPADPH